MESYPELLLQEIVRDGSAIWVDVTAPNPQQLSHYLTFNRVSAHAARTHGADLYLACASAVGLPGSAEAFDRGPLRGVIAAVRRVTANQSLTDEAMQRTRIKLLVGPPPRIATYGGCGTLVSWVRVVAVRVALDLVGERNIGGNAAFLEELALTPHSHAGYMTTEYRAEFESALGHGLKSLTARDRTLIRLHFLDQLSLDALGKVYQVHRATMARWLLEIRQRVLENVRQELRGRLDLTTADVHSLWRALQDQVDVSVSRILRTGSPGGEERNAARASESG